MTTLRYFACFVGIAIALVTAAAVWADTPPTHEIGTAVLKTNYRGGEALAVQRSTWVGNTFRSPTGNLVCKYRGWTDRIACGSYASQKIVSMTSTSRPVEGSLITFGDEQSHLLPYGTDWHTVGRAITCSSRFSGIRCTNKAGWAFLVYRQGVDVFYRGAYLWSL